MKNTFKRLRGFKIKQTWSSFTKIKEAFMNCTEFASPGGLQNWHLCLVSRVSRDEDVERTLTCLQMKKIKNKKRGKRGS